MNQEIKQSDGKRKLSLVPMRILNDIAEVREYGIFKYTDSNSWKQVEVERYVDALLRHTILFVQDFTSIDAESKIEHYKHMACNMAFICELLQEVTTE